jgi:hypothetical protein
MIAINFFLVVLRFELRQAPSALFALGISETGSHIYAQTSLECEPIYASCLTGMTGGITMPNFY